MSKRTRLSVLMVVMDQYDLMEDRAPTKRYLETDPTLIVDAWRSFNMYGYRVILATMPGRRVGNDVQYLTDSYHGLNFPLPLNELDEDILSTCQGLYAYSNSISFSDFMQLPQISSQINYFFATNKLIALHGTDGFNLLNPEPSHLPKAVDKMLHQDDKSVADYSRFIMDVISNKEADNNAMM